jgi:hypothetical protein
MRKLRSVFVGILAGMLMLSMRELGMGKEAGFEVLSQIGMDTSETESMASPPSTNYLDPLPEGTFNVQIQALEVTQGVRGDIPSRTAPADDLILLPDDAVHVADRRTVVRAYPWVITGPNTTVPPLSAQLWAYRGGELLPGSPIHPVNSPLGNIFPDRLLSEMRSDAYLSWNFVLPSEWTETSSKQKSFTLSFLVEANPIGPDHISECYGCTADNTITLGGQSFVQVPPITIKPYFVDHTFTDLEGNLVHFPAPTLGEFFTALDTVHKLLPIGDGERGIMVLEPTYIPWNGPLSVDGNHIFKEAMIQQYLPGGSEMKNQDRVYHVFIFSPSTRHRYLVNSFFEGARLGLASLGGSYVQAGARGSELVHELTHAIGLDHAGNKHGETTYNPDYPDDCGRVEPNAYGFDVWSMQAIPPDFGLEGTHDFMSYDGSNPEWVSIYTWKTVAGLLGQPNL